MAAWAAAVGGLGITGPLMLDLAYDPDDEPKILGSASVLTTAAMTIVTLAVAIFTLVMPPLDPRIPWLLVLVIAMGIFRRFEFLESWFILNGTIQIVRASCRARECK